MLTFTAVPSCSCARRNCTVDTKSVKPWSLGCRKCNSKSMRRELWAFDPEEAKYGHDSFPGRAGEIEHTLLYVTSTHLVIVVVTATTTATTTTTTSLVVAAAHTGAVVRAVRLPSRASRAGMRRC